MAFIIGLVVSEPRKSSNGWVTLSAPTEFDLEDFKPDVSFYNDDD